MTKKKTITEARNDFARLVREVEKGGSVEITRLGEPVAVLLSVETLERLRSGKTGFWDALMSFRSRAGLDALALAEALEDVRDPGVGRSAAV